jgi:Asp/Glu/hydantoin racemase
MRLIVFNPNTSVETTARMVAIAAAEAGGRATVEGVTARFGAPLITEPEALAVAATAALAEVDRLREADGVIVSAFGDPGLEMLRERITPPVTGIAEAGMAEAAANGRRFAVVTTTPFLVDAISARAAALGHGGFVGVWTTPGDPAALTAAPGPLRAALAAACRRAITEGGAEAVVIGGGPLAEAARDIAGDCPVPLIEPLPAAVRLSLARLEGRS